MAVAAQTECAAVTCRSILGVQEPTDCRGQGQGQVQEDGADERDQHGDIPDLG